MAQQLDALRDALEGVRARWGEHGETVLDTGMEYVQGEPVRVHVRKGGHHYRLDDLGTAVRLAGAPRGWRALVERLVAEEGYNVNRAGVVFVGGGERSADLGSLATRLAELSLRVYDALLDED